MNRLKGVLPFLKKVAKYSIYVLAALEIIQFAVDKIESLNIPESPKIEENEQVVSE
ncbi:hypothetical protein [Flavobacterium sp. ov086]|uniref:hypothetical protein n=1 Tax=Flavobacterium sp. ov086 TaxID=1761785 RepID=UPI000B65CA72|nr:hypothetical protein [Flavobacterium sp. ov086]SNS02572.1 hypothetical protein SAMN04487979_14517 [Flavobacterium sp. ov086]